MGLGEIPSLDEPIDRLILHAVLRTHIPSYMESEEVLQRKPHRKYMMSTHSLVKVKHEMEAIDESVAHIDMLKSKTWVRVGRLLDEI